MNANQSNESFLLTQFREFYTEIIRLKRLIKDSEIPTIEAPAPEPAGNGNGNGNGPSAGPTESQQAEEGPQ